MDTCALILVGVEEMNPLQARMTFAMARQVVVEMARTSGVRAAAHEKGARLPHAEFLALSTELRAASLQWDDGSAREDTLAALRATYEPILQALSAALLMPLPGWLPQDGATDHWQEGHRGQLASHLVQQLTERAPTPDPPPRERLRMKWRRPTP